MSGWSRLLAAAVLAVAGAVAAPLSAPAHADTQPGWLVGAAKVDITPPAFSAADDATDFGAKCSTGGFSGRRQFRYEEPYVDANGNGFYDFGEPYCDANGNGRWDGIFDSGGVADVMKTVHDRIYVRAFAVGDGTHTVVTASVTAQGLFKNYIDQMRACAIGGCGVPTCVVTDPLICVPGHFRGRPAIDGVVVSANHNESSPDTVGIYGAPDLGNQGVAGGRSGIDDYYMRFLVQSVAAAADEAYDDMQPGTLGVTEVAVPSNLAIRLSKNFPTTDDHNNGVALDPHLRVLQARDASGQTVFTVMNLAAHNQEVGHHTAGEGIISEDWPGQFERALDAAVGGTSIFLVGDNGSIEDPNVDSTNFSFDTVHQTGVGFADLVKNALPSLTPLTPGRVSLTTRSFDVPLQNNLFLAAAAAGLFGTRTGDVNNGTSTGPVAVMLQTEVGYVDLGPDLQLLLYPGEAFPALAVGSPWGIEDAPCSDRANPEVPAWHARAPWRFEVGLADDMLGYLIPAWAFATEPGFTQSTCTTDTNDNDSKGHHHKLEDESVGWDAANLIANNLSGLLDAAGNVAARAVGLWLTAPGGSSLPGDGSTLIALPAVRSFGTGPSAVAPRFAGQFVDYDGRVQPDGPDLSTRGMVVTNADGSLRHRWYADVYPALTTAPLGAAQTGPGPALPEAPLVALIPIAGLVAAGAVALRRRRTRG